MYIIVFILSQGNGDYISSSTGCAVVFVAGKTFLYQWHGHRLGLFVHSMKRSPKSGDMRDTRE